MEGVQLLRSGRCGAGCHRGTTVASGIRVPQRKDVGGHPLQSQGAAATAGTGHGEQGVWGRAHQCAQRATGPTGLWAPVFQEFLEMAQDGELPSVWTGAASPGICHSSASGETDCVYVGEKGPCLGRSLQLVRSSHTPGPICPSGASALWVPAARSPTRGGRAAAGSPTRERDGQAAFS